MKVEEHFGLMILFRHFCQQTHTCTYDMTQKFMALSSVNIASDRKCGKFFNSVPVSCADLTTIFGFFEFFACAQLTFKYWRCNKLFYNERT